MWQNWFSVATIVPFLKNQVSQTFEKMIENRNVHLTKLFKKHHLTNIWKIDKIEIYMYWTHYDATTHCTASQFAWLVIWVQTKISKTIFDLDKINNINEKKKIYNATV